ncbi:hypothetical protein [Trichormus azollae]|uniref:hypothetical protein n=1 Tax=Trichormus azollae TaxID=1164 RepID=UPI00325F331F
MTTVKQNQVWILEDYQVKQCCEPTKGRKSSDIVRNILGVSELRPDTEKRRTLRRLFEAIDNGQLEEVKRLHQELQHWQSFDPDMTRADMQIRRLERRNAEKCSVKMYLNPHNRRNLRIISYDILHNSNDVRI